MITVTQLQQDMAMAEKRRKGKDRPAGPMTDAHVQAEAEMAEGERDALDRGAGEAARKTIADRGATDPGAEVMPPHDMPDAGAWNRPYLETGTAAQSPQQGPPNVAPLPPQHPGILQPLPQSAVATVVGTGPAAAGIAAHQARAAQSMPPMPPARG